MSTPLANQPPPPTPGKRWLIGFAIAAAVILPIIVLATIYEPNGGAQDDGPARNPVTRDRADGDEIRAYCLEHTMYMEEIGDLLGEIHRQQEIAVKDHRLLLDDDWQQTISAYLANIDEAAGELLTMDAPDAASALHKEITIIASDFQEYAKHYQIGTYNLDSAEISKGTEALQRAIDRMNRAVDTGIAKDLCQR